MIEEKAAGAEWGEVAGKGDGNASAAEQASATRSGLRAAIDRASCSVRGWTRAGEEWAEGRAIELGKGLRDQGARAAGGVARQVEQNPLASVAIAFVLGFVCAALVGRNNRRLLLPTDEP
jgi:hypothetical protein